MADQLTSLLTSLAAHRPVGDPGVDAADRARTTTIPVTLLTGFLGAGKSTLLARLLAEPGDAGLVRAVVNDVGRLPFDPTLIEAGDGARIELTNGCGCCAAGAASELGARLDEVADGADLVILEAGGTADPAALAQVVQARPGLRLGRTVAVVDAGAIDRLLAMPGVAAILVRQLDTAEALILSHADGLVASERAAAIERLATLAPGRPVVTSGLAKPAHRVLAPEYPIGAAVPLAGPPSGPPTTARSFGQRRPIGRAALVAALDRGPGGLLRAKGRLLVDGRPTLVQLTPSGLSLTPAEPGPLGLTVVSTVASAHEAVAELLGRADERLPAPPASAH